MNSGFSAAVAVVRLRGDIFEFELRRLYVDRNSGFHAERGEGRGAATLQLQSCRFVS